MSKNEDKRIWLAVSIPPLALLYSLLLASTFPLYLFLSAAIFSVKTQFLCLRRLRGAGQFALLPAMSEVMLIARSRVLRAGL